MVKFVADSSCDMLEMEGVHFATAPLTICTNESSWVDDASLSVTEMLDTLENYKGKSHTACPNGDAWLEAFGDADTIYVGALTSGLSGTYSSAMMAAETYRQAHPDAKIHVFDTLSTGPELRLFMEKLIELDAQGLPFEEVVKQAQAYLKRTHLFFSFRSLHNFAQNGRVSKAVAAAVGILGIRIVGAASPEGKVEPFAKCRGDVKALAELMKQLEQLGFKNTKLRLSHTENPELANTFYKQLKEKYPEADIIMYEARGLTSYYGERGAIFLGVEV